MPRAFEPYHELCMRCGCILSCFNFGILPNLTLGAMFPGRWPNYPESMWNYGWSTPSFSSPQPAVPPGQFCGSDMMSQQSQAQSQAQTQAQLAHLREQNSILNQQLASQAQTHIQHLQQLLPFHQSTSHPPQSTPTAPEPPTPVATQSTPPGPSAPFSAEEMMQQMKNTVESSMQAFVDKNQERNMSHPPTPAQPPIQASPPIPSHPLPSDEVLPPPQHSYRRSRSRSHRHRGAPDKRPLSVPRSPRRGKSPRRTHRSSRPRSSHRRRRSTSRNYSRRPSRATSVTLRSASPRRREVLPDRDDDHGRDEPSHRPATLHPASWEHQHYHQDPSSHNDYSQHDYPSYDQPSTNKWKSWSQWKDYPKPQYRTHPSGWIDYPKASSKHHSYYDSSSKPSTKPLTAFSSDHNPNRSRQPPHRSGSVQSRVSTSAVPPGHVAINLQDGSRDEWARHIKHALNHPERMRAANELTADERPQPTTSIQQEEYDVAMEHLHQVDPRIPGDVLKKAVQLFFSTNLLPDYDLSTCHVRELPHTNMLALVMPLPDITRFEMPPPFGKQHNHTWALCHGTTIKTAQLYNPLGGQDQTCKLVLPQKSTKVPLTNLWGILPWQRSLKC